MDSALHSYWHLFWDIFETEVIFLDLCPYLISMLVLFTSDDMFLRDEKNNNALCLKMIYIDISNGQKFEQ